VIVLYVALFIAGLIAGGSLVWRLTHTSAKRLAADARESLAESRRLHQEIIHRPHPAAELVQWAEAKPGRKVSIRVERTTKTAPGGGVGILLQEHRIEWRVHASESTPTRTTSANAAGDLSTACQTMLKELGA
jgi:hypothetical protein